MSWGVNDGTGYSGYNINFFDGTILLASDAYVPATDETLDSLDVYCYDSAGGANILVGIYDITSGTNTATLVASTTVAIPVAGAIGWYNFAITGTLTAGRTYARAVCKTSTETAFLGRVSASNYSRNQTASVTSLPDPYGSGHANYSYNFAIFVNSTPAGDPDPVLTVSTDPITGSVSGTTDISTTATAYRITAGGVIVTQALDGSPVTGTSFSIASLDRGNLPALASVAETGAQTTVELMNGETVIGSDSVDLDTAAGTFAEVVASADITSANSIYNPLYASASPIDGDQHQWTTATAVVIAADGKVTGEGGFSVRHWDSVSKTWGDWAEYTVSNGVIIKVRGMSLIKRKATLPSIITTWG